METKDFSPEKSLQLISEMMQKSRHDFSKNAGSPLLLWGSVVLAVSVAVWLLWSSTGNPAWNWLWFLISVIGYPLSFLRRDKEPKAKNFLNEMLGWTWIAFGVFAVVIALLLYVAGMLSMPVDGVDIMIVEIVLLGFAASLTGTFVKNRFIMAGGLLTAAGGVLGSYMLAPEMTPLIMAGGALVTLIVPGLILNLQVRRGL